MNKRSDSRKITLFKQDLLSGLLSLFFLITFCLVNSVTGAEKITNEDCLDCHSEKQTKKVNGKDVPLLPFPTNDYSKSVHSKILCVDCHSGIKEAVHESNPPPPQCNNCHPEQPSHQKAFEEYTKSIHGTSRTMGASAAASCWDCHGSHAIMPVKTLESPVFKLNLPQTCGKCHSNPELTQEYNEISECNRAISR